MHFGIVLGGIWLHFCLHLAIQIPSKNVIEILLIFRLILGGILGSLGFPFGSQNRSKNQSRPPVEHREAPGACPGASGPSKVTKNGAQSEPKTLKIDHLDVSMLPKRSPRAPNMESHRTLDFQKWSLAQGSQNHPKINQNIKPNKPKFRKLTRSNMEPTWHQLLIH